MTRRHFRHEAPATARDRGGGTGVASTRTVISVYPPARRHRESGFTLVEVLIVLVIMGVLVALVTVPVNSYWQRARTETTAGDIRNFLQQAFTESINQRTPINVTLHIGAGIQTLTLTPAPLRSPGTYTIPDFVKVVSANTNWPPDSGDWKLICDTFGRAIDPTGQQVRSTQTIAITHIRMADGSLTPSVRYDVQVFPVWNVTVRKTVL